MKSHNKKLVDFILLSPPRSGSTYIRHMLSSHPDITCKAELFGIHAFPHPYLNHFTRTFRFSYRQDESSFMHLCKRCWNCILYIPTNWLVRRRDMDPIAYLRNIRRAEHYPKRYFGFKLLLPHSNGIAVLPELAPLKIIYLRRRNIVKQAISHEVASIRNRWHKRRAQDKMPTFYIEPAKLLEKIQIFKDQYQLQEKIVSQLEGEFLELVYEDFFEDIPTHLRKVAAFFDVDPEKFKQDVQLFKYTPRDLREIVRNFDEIHQVLESEELCRMLTDKDN